MQQTNNKFARKSKHKWKKCFFY